MEPTTAAATTAAEAATTTPTEVQEDPEVVKMLEQLKKEGFYLSQKGIYEVLDACEENASLDRIKSQILNVL